MFIVKPKLETTGTLIEGIPSHLTCILNETVSQAPTFLWSLDGYDISSNSSQRQINKIWRSTLEFHPIRSYFSKEIECMIDNDEKRVDSVVIEMNCKYFRYTAHASESLGKNDMMS